MGLICEPPKFLLHGLLSSGKTSSKNRETSGRHRSRNGGGGWNTRGNGDARGDQGANHDGRDVVRGAGRDAAGDVCRRVGPLRQSSSVIPFR